MNDQTAVRELTPSQREGCALLERVLTGALLASALFLGTISLVFTWTIIGVDAPVEYRENAVVFTTELLVAGENPYDLEHQPLFINAYGLGYHWIVLPLARHWGSGFLVHRAVSALFVILSCAVLFCGLYRTAVSWPLALAAAVLWLIHLSRGLSIVARPDSFGMFLFLLSVLIPGLWEFAPWSLSLSLILGTLGLLTKPYFVFGIPCLATYLFLFRGKRLGVRYAVSGLLLTGATVAVMHARFPYYLTNTVIINVNVAGKSFAHLQRIAAEYQQAHIGVVMILVWAIVISLICGVERLRQDSAGTTAHPWVNFRDPGKPLLGFSLGLMPFMLLCGVLVMIAVMGRHHGNDILYYDQLISPFLYWVVTTQMQRLSALKIPCLILLLSTLWTSPQALVHAPIVRDKEWNVLEGLIARHHHVFASPPLAHILRRQGKPVYNTGQTEFFIHGARNNIRQLSEAYLQRGEEFAARIRSTAVAKGFDLVMLAESNPPFFPKDILSRNYALADSMVVPLHFQGGGRRVQIYYPTR